MPDSVNDKLLDRAIMHAHYLERFKTQEAHRIINYIKRNVIPDIIKQIKKLEGFGLPASMRQQEMVKELTLIVNTGLDGGYEKLLKDMEKFAVAQATFEVGMMKQIVPIKLDFIMPNPETLRALVNKATFQGQGLKGVGLKRLWSQFKGSMRKDVVNALRNGIAEGEDVPTLLQRVRGTGAFSGEGLKTSIRHAEAVARTTANHVSTVTREQVYADNSDIVKGVRYIATLDSKTTEICMSLDGQVFPVNEGARPPMHYNCRSTTVPVLKSWEELGIPLKEIPEGTRRAMNGKVPASTTYGEWLKKQPQSVIEEALGKKKAQLFAEGKVDVQSFVNNRFRTLTLKELAEKEGFMLEEVK